MRSCIGYFKLNFHRKKFSKKKGWDGWAYIIASIIGLAGVVLLVLSAILLSKSYDLFHKNNNHAPLAAYAGGIGGGITVILGAITQIFVFRHRAKDENNKRFQKSEHDFTNFFIKNVAENDLIIRFLDKINNDLNLSCVFTGNNGLLIESDVNSNVSSASNQYFSKIKSEIKTNTALIDVLVAKNHIRGTGTLSESYLLELFRYSFKNMSESLEKMIQTYLGHSYDLVYFKNIMKRKIDYYAITIIPFLILIIGEKANEVFNNDSLESYSHILYYLNNQRKL